MKTTTVPAFIEKQQYGKKVKKAKPKVKGKKRK